MGQRSTLTITQREAIYMAKLGGQTLKAVAAEQQCSFSCARKWWRRGRDHGREGLRRRRRPRPAQGALSTFAPLVAERALYWKRQHPKRGPNRILQDLAQDALLIGLPLPKRSTLAAFFQRVCPELLQKHHARPAAPPRPGSVHACWQIDGKEAIHLLDGTIATILDIREPVACAFLANRAHAVQTAKGWRKLTVAEIQADLREAFTAFGLPDSIQTDREHVYGQPAQEAFPSPFTLWLIGLGIGHAFSRPSQATDQAQVERGHRTLWDWMEQPEPPPNLSGLQAALDRARQMHNTVLSSEAGDCDGRIPFDAHPEVLQPRRPYDPAVELELFSLERVDHFLAQFTWHYKVTPIGQVFVQGRAYYVGQRYAGKQVEMHFDPQDRHLIFAEATTGQLLTRRPLRGLEVATLTGLAQSSRPLTWPIQLSFPWAGGTLIAGQLGVQH